jgi:hypothetical protein
MTAALNNDGMRRYSQTAITRSTIVNLGPVGAWRRSTFN